MKQNLTFRKKVYLAVSKIPKGKVATYSQIAVAAESPKGARAVGQALHFLDDDTVPWWRVVNSKGEISLRCEEHPKSLQKALLENDGVQVGKGYKLDLKKYIVKS